MQSSVSPQSQANQWHDASGCSPLIVILLRGAGHLSNDNKKNNNSNNNNNAELAICLM
jgi:hypothetical protein